MSVRFILSNSAKLLLVLLGMGLPVFAQLTLGDNTQMNMSGNASMGYSHISGTDLPTSSSLDIGFDGSMTGFYYNPSFLSFRANPYYNRSRTNSDSTSIFGTKGFDSGLNLFSGGHTPIGFGYSKSWDNEQLLNVPGSLSNFVARGAAQNISLTGGLLFEGLPSLNIGWTRGSSTSSTFGSAAGVITGSGSMQNFSLSSAYQIAGFSLAGGYTRTHTLQVIPDIAAGEGTLNANSYQKTLHFEASRALSRTTNLNTTFTHNNFSGDGGSGSSGNASFSTMTVNVAMRPTVKLSTNAFFDYTTNYGAYLLERVLSTNGGDSVLVKNLTSSSSSYLDFGGSGTYAFTQHLSATGLATMRKTSAQGLGGTSRILTSSVSYGKPMLGGNVGFYGSVSKASSAFLQRSQNQTGEAAGITSGRRLFGWDLNAGVQFQHSTMLSTLPVTQSGMSWSVSTSHKVVGAWRFVGNATHSQSRVNEVADANAGSDSYSANFSGRLFSFGGTYSKSNGDSLLTAAGLVPVGGGDVLPGTSLILYNGSSYALNGTFHPSHNLSLWADYSHALYSTTSPITNSSGMLDRYDARADYFFRRMHITAGYSHLSQGFGSLVAHPISTDAFSIGIARSFDIF